MRLIKFTVLLVLFGGGYIHADYNEPPGWEDCNDFTHQSWDFLTDESDNLPAAPDGQPDAVNPYGTAGLVDIEYTTAFQFWMWDPYSEGYMPVPTDRRGFYGGMGDTTLTFEIPNNERDGFWLKQLWIQVVYWARKDTIDNYEISIGRDSDVVDANGIEIVSEKVEDLNEPEGSIGKFYSMTAAARFDDQPGIEYASFTAYQYPPDSNHSYGGASMIDHVRIETRCVNLDVIEDNIINFRDYAVLAKNFYEPNLPCDLSPDGLVDERDLKILFDYWLQSG